MASVRAVAPFPPLPGHVVRNGYANKAIAVSNSSSLEKKLSYNYLMGCYFQFDKNLLENLNNHSV